MTDYDMLARQAGLQADRFIIVNPELASRAGLNEAIVLQQLTYWVLRSTRRKEANGLLWVPGKLDWWAAQFPFWSERTIQRAFASLRSQDLVIVRKTIRWNWYAINFDAAVAAASRQDDASQHKETEEEKGKKTASQSKKPAAAEPSRNLTRELWDLYCDVMERQDRYRKLEPANATLISKALDVRPFDDCRLAILGLRRSPFHNGDNPQGKKYLSIDHALRGKKGVRSTGDQIDMMKAFAVGASQAEHGFPTADPATLRQKMTEVQQAVGTKDETALTRGRAAAAWLKDHGFKTVVKGGTASFERLPAPSAAVQGGSKEEAA